MNEFELIERIFVQQQADYLLSDSIKKGIEKSKGSQLFWLLAFFISAAITK